MTNFAERIRHYRSCENLTQKEIADKLGLTENIWQKYELGELTPTVEGLIAIADLFKIPVEFLLGRIAPDLCSLIEIIAICEPRCTVQEQMSLFLREAAYSFLESNELIYCCEVEGLGSEEEWEEAYNALDSDDCDDPDSEQPSDSHISEESTAKGGVNISKCPHCKSAIEEYKIKLLTVGPIGKDGHLQVEEFSCPECQTVIQIVPVPVLVYGPIDDIE